MTVSSLGYLRLTSNAISAWRVLAADLLGMMQVDGPDRDSIYFRMDEYPPRLVVTPSESSVAVIGFETRSQGDLEQTAVAVEGSGIKVSVGTESECKERSISGFIRFDDPGGNAIEVFYGPIFDHVRVQTPQVSAFVTGDLGMGHVIVSAQDPLAEREFYIGTLGFRDRNTFKLPDGKTLWFLGCNPRQHGLAIYPMDGPGRLIHFMVEAATLADVGRAFDRIEMLKVPLQQSLGEHTNDHMVSFYVYSPDGHTVELGCGGLHIRHEVPTYEITLGSEWGHKFFPLTS